MDLNLKDKIIIVTGGAKGIGAAIVTALSNEGAIPVIVGRNEDDNLLLLQKLPDGMQIVAELSEPESAEMIIQKTIDKYGKIDGLINNAGHNDGVGLENGNYADFVASYHKNVVHYYLLAHFCLPYLKKTQGSIVNISSKTAETGQGNTSGYAASNGARNALTREWAVELLKYNIRVNAVIVAECMTPQYEKWIQTLPDPETSIREITRNIPLGERMTRAEEIADTVLFLLSEKSSHTTGQLIHVDGGYVHLDRALANAK